MERMKKTVATETVGCTIDGGQEAKTEILVKMEILCKIRAVSRLANGGTAMQLRKASMILLLVFAILAVRPQASTGGARFVPQPGSFKTLYRFAGGMDGEYPEATLIRGQAGGLVGTTYAGGAYGLGTAFEVDPGGKETVLHSFGENVDDGTLPDSSLIQDAAGNFYGVTPDGGRYGAGVVFKLDATGKETILYTFTGGADGSIPEGSLVRDVKGNLYGTTYDGGAHGRCDFGYGGYGCGVVFKLDAAGKETVLYTFLGGTDGAFPVNGLLRDDAGNLYGTTLNGGDFSCSVLRSGCGVAWMLTKLGSEIVLHSFTNGLDGGFPSAGLTEDANGNFYGTTSQGGTTIYGTVFKLTPRQLGFADQETVLYNFTGGADGKYPGGGLIRDAAGNLYGTTGSGGSGYGVVFRLGTGGTEVPLYTFTGAADGAYPWAGLVRGSAGYLYGTTRAGGRRGTCTNEGAGCGTVFAVRP
jgi:uncharacterized repeat protein (TIGR03803 family)